VIGAFRGLRANFLVQDYLPEAAGRDIRCLVLGGKFIAALERKAPGNGDLSSKPHTKLAKTTKAERDTAQKAARAFKLGLASVDLLRTPEGPKVLSLSATPGLSRFETASGRNIAALVLDHLEQRLRPATTRPRRTPRA
jgi:ribosomal protein S6--L-glutamate ligase